MTHLEAAFTIEDWKGEPIDDLGAGPEVSQATLRKTYTGELDGTSTTVFLGTQGEGGRAYVAQERIVGSLAGREGTFVVQHGAVDGDGMEPRQWAFVVPGSGTGALASLRGEGRVEHGLLILDYDLDG